VGERRPSARGRRAGTRVVCAVALILIFIPGHDPAVAATKVPGIDVSKWQGAVDWTAVASTAVRFVIIRATRGNDYDDPKYAEYLAEASANGLVVGAYHRAKVGVVAGDAKDEADHFIDVAQNDAGDVLPVLDIEEANGLNVAKLTDWVRSWLTRVHARTGVRAMIYSSPYFWRTHLGDTRWFANHGYPLWIAHWGVPAPSVPAGVWGGHGWTFWQRTSTGRVAGIATEVDRDRFNGFGLLRGKIVSLTVTPAAGGVITGARIACGGAETRCDRLANPDSLLTLAATPATGASLLRWNGACSAAGSSPTCDVTALGARTTSAVFAYPVRVKVRGSGGGTVTSAPARIDCGVTCTAPFAAGSTVDLTADADSASAFVGWSGGGCGGAGPVCSVSVSSPRTVIATFNSVVSIEQDGAGTAFGWGRASHPDSIGGSYRWERRSGAAATYAFSGGAVTVFTISGPKMGRGRIEIDGATMETFDGYSRALATRAAHRFEGLGPGAHTLTVRVLGTKRPAAAGTRVGVDALRWGGQTHPDPPAAATWAVVTSASASGGSYAISDAREAFTRLRFRGTGASIRTLRGPAMGRAEVWVDGDLEGVVDLYAPAAGLAKVPLASGLVDGPHTVRVVVLGSHRGASAGRSVVVDRWVVV
jgi:GH25 family lysozyme M1 (1,4-beta-N-acetylmuramidase)